MAIVSLFTSGSISLAKPVSLSDSSFLASSVSSESRLIALALGVSAAGSATSAPSTGVAARVSSASTVSVGAVTLGASSFGADFSTKTERRSLASFAETTPSASNCSRIRCARLYPIFNPR